ENGKCSDILRLFFGRREHNILLNDLEINSAKQKGKAVAFPFAAS
ncbi:MAG: hypothetical protein JWM83_830, partial [Candidatus Angelobacter sp.]|nr:hypothetical protein [Candidatus Angelobacter sp.]